MKQNSIKNQKADQLVRLLFERMLKAAGPRQWWPCDRTGPGCGRDEIILGAVLTQNTAWKNVEQALANLRSANLLSLAKIATLDPEDLAPLIRPAGYFNLKARRLHSVAEFFAPGGRERFEELAQWSDEGLRRALLGVWGLGPETVDSILLYALGRLSFVIDAYTLRIGRRHGLFKEKTSYEEARSWFTAHAPADAQVYNEYHALLVWIGNLYCKPTPRCGACPLASRECCLTAASWKSIQAHR